MRRRDRRRQRRGDARARPPLLDAARIGPDQIAAELGGLSPGKLHAAELAADALARALGAAVRERAALAGTAPAARTLVAMSGGVDSAVAALLVRRDGDTVAVTLELWADDENDAERSCCSASAVAQARALAHSMGLPHFTIDLRDEFRAGVVEPFIAGYAAGETPNPCVGCNGHVRLDAMLELADRLGCDAARDRPLRADRRADDDERAAAAGRRRPRQGPDLHARRARARVARRMRFPLGELTKPEVRRDRRRRRAAGRRARPTPRISASSPAPTAPGSSPATARSATARGRRRPRGSGVGRHAASSGSRSVSGAGSGSPAASRCTCSTRTPTHNRVIVGPRARCARPAVAVRGAAAPPGRAGRPRQAPLPLAADRARGWPATRRRAGTPTLELELDAAVDGAAPGQLACLMDGEFVVGWGTIARAISGR